jgi:hypothetical protein
MGWSPSTLYNVPGVKGYIHSNYGEVWTAMPDMDCDAYIPSTYGAPSFQSMLCYKTPAAKGYIASLDSMEDSPALCGTNAEISALCWSLEDCYGYVMQSDATTSYHYGRNKELGQVTSDSERGYLLKYDCGIASAKKSEIGSTLYEKMEPTYDTCPLGEVMTVMGGFYPEVSGVYAKTTDFGGDSLDAYKKVDGLAKVTWHSSSCGWVVSRKVMPTPMGFRQLEACEGLEDSPAVLGALLGSDASEDLCETLVEGWGHAAYCNNPIVGKLCAKTCERCDLVSTDLEICENAACGHSVFKVLCPTKCASSTKKMDPKVMEARVTDLILRVKDVLPAWKAKMIRGEEAEMQARKLGQEPASLYQDMYEEVFTTFQSLADGTPPNCSAIQEPTDMYVHVPQMFMYDVVGMHMPQDVSLQHYCPTTKDAYVTTNFTYCPRTNIDVQYHPDPMVSDNSCWTKCGTYGNTTDTFFDDGTTDWCSGFSPTFVKETAALCIPRETCEEICTKLGPKCHSIDMHRSRPLCYLNDADAGTGNSCDDPNYIKSEYQVTEFDLLTKTTTPSAPEKDTERITWKTYTGKRLAIPRDEWPTMRNYTYYTYGLAEKNTHHPEFGEADRVHCEVVCLRDPYCYGFYLDMGANPPYCSIVGYDCKNEDGSGRPCSPEPVLESGYFTPKGDGRRAPGAPNLVGHGTFVLKQVPQPCWALYDFGANDDLVLKKKLGYAPDGSQYVSSDNLTRLAFYQDVQGCDGWRLENHNDPFGTSVTLHNCTDYPAGANIFLKAYLNKYPADGMKADFQFPCQYAYDEGLCHNIVIQGLCAHTCTELEYVYLQGNITKYQDTDLVIDYAMAGLPEPKNMDIDHTNNTDCRGNNDVAAYAFIKTYIGSVWNGIVNGPNATGDYLFNYCDDLARWKKFYNTTHSACAHRLWSPIVVGLCKEACIGYMDPVDPPTTPPPIDETSPTGALFTYNRRLLKWDEMKVAADRAKLVEDGELAEDGSVLGDDPLDEEDRRLRKLFFTPGEYTTSNMGAGSGFYETFIEDSITVHYTDGTAPMSSWTPFLQTWVNGSANPNSIYNPGFVLNDDYTYTLGQICPMNTTAGTADMYAIMTPYGQASPEMVTMYPSLAAQDNYVSLDYACRTTTPCPKYFTCVVDQPRANIKFDAFTALTAADLVNLETGVKPNVIVSSEASFGYVVAGGGKYKLTPKIYRSEVGSTEVEITSDGVSTAAFAYTLRTVTTAAAGYYLEQYEGFTLPPTYSYISDIIKVDAIGPAGTPIVAPLGVKIRGIGSHSTKALVKLLSVAGDGSVTPVATFDASSDYADSLGQITFDLAPGTYVVGLLPSRCFDDPCDENAVCDPAATGAHPCTCTSDYEGSGLNGECALKPDKYTMDDFNYYVKIINTDALQFGWHVSDIDVKLEDSAGTALTTKTKDAIVDFPASLSVTGKTITALTKFYTGPIGKSHYPYVTDKFTVTDTGGTYKHGNKNGAKYGSQNLGDGDKSTWWWSEALNVYPESQSIEFILPGDKELTGITVGQEASHASSYRVEIGPVSDPDNPACGMAEGMMRCAPYHIVDVYICSMNSDCPKSLPFCVGGGGSSPTGQCSDTAYTDDTPSSAVNTKYVTDAANNIVISTPISCGKADTQIFGEVMVFATSEVNPLRGGPACFTTMSRSCPRATATGSASRTSRRAARAGSTTRRLALLASSTATSRAASSVRARDTTGRPRRPGRTGLRARRSTGTTRTAFR